MAKPKIVCDGCGVELARYGEAHFDPQQNSEDQPELCGYGRLAAKPTREETMAKQRQAARLKRIVKQLEKVIRELERTE